MLSETEIGRAVGLLLRGAVVAIPTDTVYGVAALPSLPEAVDRLFEAKNRPADKAIPYLLADPAAIEIAGAEITAAARRLAASFWPGGLTIVVQRRTPVPGAPPTVAVRVPALALAQHVITSAGGVLAVTSANISGAANCTTATDVLAQLDGRIAAVVDGGLCPGGTESTVVDATRETVRVLRVGAISRAQLLEVVQLD